MYADALHPGVDLQMDDRPFAQALGRRFDLAQLVERGHGDFEVVVDQLRCLPPEDAAQHQHRAADAGAAQGDALLHEGDAEAVDAAGLRGHVDAETFLAGAEQEGVTIIDVRSPAEYAEGHLPGALNINVEDPTFAAQIAELDTAGTYALYCRSGNRSRVAEEAMLAEGFTNVFGLEDGVGALDPADLVTD